MSEIVKELHPHIVTFAIVVLTGLGGILTAIAAALAVRIKKWADRQDQAVARQGLHQALETGAKASRQRGVVDKDTIAADAIEYAEKSVPGLLKELKPKAEVLATIAQTK